MLSDNLKKLRKTKGWSQEELATKLNVVRQTVSKWEKGLSVPDSEMLIRIADELDTSVNILLGETIEPDENLKENAELKVIAAKLEILNEQFTKRSEKQRKVWMTVFIIIGAIAIITVLYELVDFIHYQAAMDAIYANKSAIGGYDGPTNIYVSNVAFKAFTLIIAMTAAVISAIGIHKTNRK